MAVIIMLPATGWSQADVIKARKDNFHALSDQMKAVIQELGDGYPISAMQPHVLAAQQALGRIPGLLPAGSDQGRTRALPVIWQEPDRFAAVYAAARDRMAELVAAAAQPDRDRFGAAAGRMAAACGTCHATFRAK